MKTCGDKSTAGHILLITSLLRPPAKQFNEAISVLSLGVSQLSCKPRYEAPLHTRPSF